MGLSERYTLQHSPPIIKELQQEMLAAVISISEKTSCSCAKFSTPAADGLGLLFSYLV
jgi:hypothetical protein